MFQAMIHTVKLAPSKYFRPHHVSVACSLLAANCNIHMFNVIKFGLTIYSFGSMTRGSWLIIVVESAHEPQTSSPVGCHRLHIGNVSRMCEDACYLAFQYILITEKLSCSCCFLQQSKIEQHIIRQTAFCETCPKHWRKNLVIIPSSQQQI